MPVQRPTAGLRSLAATCGVTLAARQVTTNSLAFIRAQSDLLGARQVRIDHLNRAMPFGYPGGCNDLKAGSNPLRFSISALPE